MLQANGRGAFFARIVGRVQGVGFRYSAQGEARRLGLSGWVRNAPDGAVEVYAEGPAVKLEEYALWLRKGPPGALVSGVEKRPVSPTRTYRTFTVEF